MKFARLFALLLLTGCAAGYSSYMGGSLKRLESRDYAEALEKLEKPDGKTNKLLYRLEKGLILHYQGAYQASNIEFEKAERLIDRLYTKSASREVAAFLTNDAIRPYSGEEFERALIHYYRAMNYQYLGQPQEALVECRKANLRLEDYAQAAEYKLSYKNDAFLQYMSGLFFAAEGEWNDAYISFKDAEKGYRAYQEAFGFAPPRTLGQDLARTARRLGYADELVEYSRRYDLRADDIDPSKEGEVIVFIEDGFIARKRQNEIQVPILDNDNPKKVWDLSDRMVDRYYRYPHRRHYRVKVDYWLKVALPYYEPVRSQVSRVRLRAGGRSSEAVLVEDLDAIAVQSFAEKEKTILLRTFARGVAKYAATQVAEEENEILGTLVNWLTASVEAADTRSWLALPGRIRMARLALPAGTSEVVVELFNGGNLLEAQSFPAVEVAADRPVFLNYRSYR
ncbi:MAG: hypothetical protein GKR89_21865 [Candidatus Latescibacteria bacterium]|nr:hypothetical protein [Candidatus Latescibacterota bacterium]